MEDGLLALLPRSTAGCLSDMRGRSHHGRYRKVNKYKVYTDLFNSYHVNHIPLQTRYNMKYNMLTL